MADEPLLDDGPWADAKGVVHWSYVYERDALGMLVGYVRTTLCDAAGLDLHGENRAFVAVPRCFRDVDCVMCLAKQ